MQECAVVLITIAKYSKVERSQKSSFGANKQDGSYAPSFLVEQNIRTSVQKQKLDKITQIQTLKRERSNVQ